jgi:hypothetical protein
VGFEARRCLREQLQALSAVLQVHEPCLTSQPNTFQGIWDLGSQDPRVVLAETGHVLDCDAFTEKFATVEPRREKVFIG